MRFRTLLIIIKDASGLFNRLQYLKNLMFHSLLSYFNGKMFVIHLLYLSLICFCTLIRLNGLIKCTEQTKAYFWGFRTGHCAGFLLKFCFYTWDHIQTSCLLHLSGSSGLWLRNRNLTKQNWYFLVCFLQINFLQCTILRNKNGKKNWSETIHILAHKKLSANTTYGNRLKSILCNEGIIGSVVFKRTYHQWPEHYRGLLFL